MRVKVKKITRLVTWEPELNKSFYNDAGVRFKYARIAIMNNRFYFYNFGYFLSSIIDFKSILTFRNSGNRKLWLYREYKSKGVFTMSRLRKQGIFD